MTTPEREKIRKAKEMLDEVLVHMGRQEHVDYEGLRSLAAVISELQHLHIRLAGSPPPGRVDRS